MTRADSVHSTPRITASKTNPPDQAPMTPDDEIGMAWWNSLSKQERAKWSAIAGNTGRPKDAWEAFRRGSVDQSPPVDPTRRRFLAVAAGASVASAGTLAVAAAMPAAAPYSAACTVDPIYAAIEAHRKACREHHDAVEIHMNFEEVGMTGAKLEKYNSLVAETDAAYDRLDDVGCDLINTKPTTLAGIFALCQYIEPLCAEDDAPDLPEYILYDDDTTATPAEALCYVIGRAAENLMNAAAGKAVLS
jgi:hypothetical protein